MELTVMFCEFLKVHSFLIAMFYVREVSERHSQRCYVNMTSAGFGTWDLLLVDAQFLTKWRSGKQMTNE